MEDEEHEEAPKKPPPEVAKTILKEPLVITIPRRKPSVVIPEKVPVYTTADKTTCAECTCFPKESSYTRRPKLRPCLQSPLTLYEYAAEMVDELSFPGAFKWSEMEVAQWMEEEVGLPEYKEAIFENHINGRRLLKLEDMSMPEINIKNFEHIKMIVTAIHKLYSTEFIKFSRSIGLPPRKPLTHCTWFKSKTGPSWGIRHNWTRCDVLRWMKILDPAPVRRNHWDLVWYQKPDFPKTMFARIPPAAPREKIPHYKPSKEVWTEFQVPRKFNITSEGVPEDQYIWNEPKVITKTKGVQTTSKLPLKVKKSEGVQVSKHKLTDLKISPRSAAPARKDARSPVPVTKRVRSPREKEKSTQKESKLVPKKICLKGLTGKKLILARRLMPKQKFIRA